MNHTDLVLTIEYFLSVLASLVFIIRYAWVKFWKTGEGVALMMVHVALAFLGLLTFLRLQFGAYYPGRQLLALAGVNILLVATWSLTLLLFRAQRAPKRVHADQTAPTSQESHPLADDHQLG